MRVGIRVINKDEITVCEAWGEDFADLVCLQAYEEGDQIELECEQENQYVKWQMDDAVGSSFLYLTEKKVRYQIPFGEKRISYSPKAFFGDRHYLYVEVAREDEVNAYRNLALNPADWHGAKGVFPHASANVETRGEAVFAARNAIDGVRANLSHGAWPYQSWGINRQDDAVIRVEFGRKIRTGKVVLYTRADFPHDNWWEQVTLRFSDESKETFSLQKSLVGHVLTFPEREITWIELGELKKADDPSPFPALSQIEVYGFNVK